MEDKTWRIGCEKTCEEPDPTCIDTKKSGCYCPEDMVWDGVKVLMLHLYVLYMIHLIISLVLMAIVKQIYHQSQIYNGIK